MDTRNHQPQKGYIQVTYVEPYFDDWELGQRVTVFDRSFNIRTLCLLHSIPCFITFLLAQDGLYSVLPSHPVARLMVMWTNSSCVKPLS